MLALATRYNAGAMKRRLTSAERAKAFKALADPTRVEIVDLLAAHGGLCGTELAERLGVSLALLCHHWEVLIDAGLVKKQRVGQLRVCTLDGARLREVTGAWAPRVGAASAQTAKRKSAARGRQR
jgi:ArsR family transcriptional regulator